eukprot:3577100-Pleurochrysis_carterae.AAC.1
MNNALSHACISRFANALTRGASVSAFIACARRKCARKQPVATTLAGTTSERSIARHACLHNSS